MKHLTFARLFVVLGAGALLADVPPSRCGRGTTTPAPLTSSIEAGAPEAEPVEVRNEA